VVDDTGGVVVVVVVCCVAPVPAPVFPAVEPAPVEPLAVEPLVDALVLTVDVVELEPELPLVVTDALPVVGTVRGGAPVVLVRLALLPLPQAARTKPAANAAIRANVRERVGIDRYLRT
jgi:hypothetical protein